jgi:arsenate reductase
MLKYYSYSGCGTCRKAKSWLLENAIGLNELAIRETPPSLDEFSLALKSGYSLKQLFNTSGIDYRELGLKNILPRLTDQAGIEMLNGNGNLVKRPFLVAPKGVLVGFKIADWEKFFQK